MKAFFIKVKINYNSLFNILNLTKKFKIYNYNYLDLIINKNSPQILIN